MAAVQADQLAGAELEDGDGLVLVGVEKQALAEAEQGMPHEEREPAVLRVDVPGAPEAEERTDDAVGGPLVQIGRQGVARRGDEICRHPRRTLRAPPAAVKPPAGWRARRG